MGKRPVALGERWNPGRDSNIFFCPGVEGEDDGHVLGDRIQSGHDGGQACGVIRILGPMDRDQCVAARGQTQGLENRAVLFGLGGVEQGCVVHDVAGIHNCRKL